MALMNKIAQQKAQESKARTQYYKEVFEGKKNTQNTTKKTNSKQANPVVYVPEYNFVGPKKYEAPDNQASFNVMPGTDTKKLQSGVLPTTKFGKSYENVRNQYASDKFGKGNIDLANRPVYLQPDGRISTVNSITIEEDGVHILIPTIAYDKNGKAVQLSDDEAVKRYHDTGAYLGKFKTNEEADAYAEQLHRDQDTFYKKDELRLGGGFFKKLDSSGSSFKSGGRDGLSDDERYYSDIQDIADKYNIDMSDMGKVLRTIEFGGTFRDATGKEISRDEYKKLKTYVNTQMAIGDSTGDTKQKTIASVDAIMQSMRGGIGMLGQLTESAFTGAPLDLNTNSAREVAAASKIRENITEGIDDDFGKFAYGVGMSMADNVARAIFYVIPYAGEAISLGSMGASAAADKAVRLKQEGKSDREAAIMGIISGAIEVVTEKIGVDNFLDIVKKGGKSIINGVVKQMAAEGTEEALSNIMNLAAELIYFGEDSDFWKSVEAYQNGSMTGRKMSRNEAFSCALGNAAVDLLYDTLGGAVSGGFFGGAGTAMNVGNTWMQGNKIVKQGGTTSTINNGLNFEQDTEAYKYAKDLDEKIKNGGQASNYAVGRQAALNAEQTTENVKANFEKELNEKGVKKAGAISEALTELLSGEEVSRKGIKLIANSSETIEILERYTGITLDTNQDISDLQRDIRNISIGNSFGDVYGVYDRQNIIEFTKGMSENAQKAFNDFYTPNLQMSDYLSEMNEAYKAGLEGRNVPRLQNLNDAQNTGAYVAGYLDRKNGEVYNNRTVETINQEKGAEIYGNEDNGYGGKWNDGIDTDQQVQGVESETRRDAQNGQDDIRSESGRSTTQENQKVKGKVATAESLKLEGGDSRNRVELVTEYEGKTEVERIANQNGVRVVAFRGDNLSFTQNGHEFSARGANQNRTIYIRTDSPVASAVQLAEHEIAHEKVRKGQINLARVKEKVYDATGGNIEVLERAYASAFDGLSADEIWEEIVCDSIANMNMFEYTYGRYDEATGMFNQMVAWYAAENEAEIKQQSQNAAKENSRTEKTVEKPKGVPKTEAKTEVKVKNEVNTEEKTESNKPQNEFSATKADNQTAKESTEQSEVDTSPKRYVSGNTGTRDTALIDEGSSSVVKSIVRDKTDVSTAKNSTAAQSIEKDKPVEIIFVPSKDGNNTFAAYFAQTEDSRGGQIASVVTQGGTSFDSVYGIDFVGETGFSDMANGNQGSDTVKVSKAKLEGKTEAVKQLLNDILERVTPSGFRGQVTFTMDDIDINNFNETSCALFSEISKYLPNSVKEILGFKSQSFGNMPRYIRFGGVNASVNPRNAVNIDSIETAQGKYVDAIDRLMSLDDAKRESVLKNITNLSELSEAVTHGRLEGELEQNGVELQPEKETRGSPEVENEVIRKAMSVVQNSHEDANIKSEDVKTLIALDKKISSAEKTIKKYKGTQREYDAQSWIREYKEQAKSIAAAYDGSLKLSRVYDAVKDFQRDFSGFIEDRTYALTDAQKRAISSAIKSGLADISEDLRYGSATLDQNRYDFFINSDNSIMVYDVIDNEELNIHDNKFEKGYEDVRNRRFGETVSGERNIQRNRAGVFFDGAETAEQTKTNGVDGRKSESDTARNISDYKGNSTKFSLVSPETDAEYLNAVENGDMETAQKMADEAAKKAFPNTKVVDKNGNPLRVYHGTENDFWTFDILKSEKNGRALGYGFYFAKRKSFAEHYGNRIVEAYIDIQKPLSDNQKGITLAETKTLINAIIDRELTEYKKDGLIWQDTFISNYVNTYSTSRNNAVQEVANIIYNANDNDSDVVYEIANASGYNYSPEAIKGFYEVLKGALGYDGYIRSEGVTDESDSVYVVFSPEQIKSADAVTYDNNGKVIPLSERFNEDSKDIRFSRVAPSYEEIRKESAELRKELAKVKGKLRAKTQQAEYWKGETRETAKNERTADQKTVKKVASEYVKDYSISTKYMSRKEIETKLTEIAEYLYRADADTDISYNDIINKAYSLASEMVESSEIINTEKEERYKRIKNYFSDITIKISDKEDITDYNAFRRRMFGKMNLSLRNGTAIDTVWEELGEMYGKDLFPDNITNPTDQVLHIASVLNDLADIYENPHEQYMDVTKEGLAIDIADKIIFGAIEEKVTISDERRAKYLDRIDRLKRTLQQVRDRRDANYAELKNSFKTYRENIKDKQLNVQLLRIMKRLSNKKLPTPNRAVQEEYAAEINRFISKYNLSAEKVTPQKETRMHEIAQRVAELQKEYPEYQPDNATMKWLNMQGKKTVSELSTDEKHELIGILLALEYDIDTYNKFLGMTEWLTTQEAGTKVMRDIENATGGFKDAFTAKMILGHLDADTAIRLFTGYDDSDPLYQAFLKYQKGETEMIRYGIEASKMFERFSGKDKAHPQYKGFYDRISGKKAEHIQITGTQHIKDGSGKTTKTESVKIEITPAMRMSIYMHSLNRQNLAHMTEGGLLIPDINSKAYKNGKMTEVYQGMPIVTLSIAEIRRIVASMSAEERAYCHEMQKYFDDMSKPRINEVALRLFGVEKANVENYFPISVESSFRFSDLGVMHRDGSVEGMGGRLNERIDSKKPILLQDANDILKQSVMLHSRFVGLSVPYRDMNKLWNVQETGIKDSEMPSALTENAKSVAYINNIKKIISDKWTVSAIQYMDDLMNVYNQGISDRSGWDKVFSNYQRARISMNLGVGLKQAASFPTAIAEVGHKAVLYAATQLFKKPNQELLSQSARYQYRLGKNTMDYGTTDVDVIQAVDTFTVAHLLPAAEFYVREYYPDLEVGSDEYNAQVLETFDNIILKTQPNYTPLQRPPFLRSKHPLTRAWNMFKTQPYQNLNILYDASGAYKAAKVEYKYYKNGNDTEKAKQAKERLDTASKKLAWAISSQISSAAVYALMQLLVDALRSKRKPKGIKKYQDKDKEGLPITTFWSVTKGLLNNMLSNSAGMVTIGNSAVAFVKYTADELAKAFGKDKIFDEYTYDFEMPVFEMINQFRKNITNVTGTTIETVGDIFTGDDIDWGKVKKAYSNAIISALELQSGTPIKNVTNVADTIISWFMPQEDEKKNTKKNTEKKKR